MSKEPPNTEPDPSLPPQLQAALRAEAQALKNLPDGTIDTSDIPPLTDEFWQTAIRNPFYKPTNTSTTTRIDSEILLWLRAQGRGYQSRLNTILRREMLQTLKRKRCWSVQFE